MHSYERFEEVLELLIIKNELSTLFRNALLFEPFLRDTTV